MNLCTAHQKTKSHKFAAVSNKQKYLFSWTVQCPCQAVRVLSRLFQTCGPVTEKLLSPNRTGPRDDANIGVDRTKMTAPRVVGDELAFLGHPRNTKYHLTIKLFLVSW